MTKFHINPETGEPGRCVALIKCKYGQSEDAHFESKFAAREHYEEMMKDKNHPSGWLYEKGLHISQFEDEDDFLVAKYGGNGMTNAEREEGLAEFKALWKSENKRRKGWKKLK